LLKSLLFIILLVFLGTSCQKHKDINSIEKLVEKKLYDKAIEEAKKEKDDKLKFNYLGIIYNKKGDIKKSEEFYQKVLKIDSKNFKARYNLALLNLKINRFKKALDILDSLSKEKPKNTDVKIKVAYCHYALESKSNAIFILKKIVDENRNSLKAFQWNEIAYIYKGLNRFQASAEALEYYISTANKEKLKIDVKTINMKINSLRATNTQGL